MPLKNMTVDIAIIREALWEGSHAGNCPNSEALAALERLAMERNRLQEELRLREQSQVPVIPHAAQEQLERYRAALEHIASPKRPDGTYNLSREACEQIAREALGMCGFIPPAPNIERTIEDGVLKERVIAREPERGCTCSPGVTSVECPWHGGTI